MKADRLNTLIAALAVLSGLLGISAGHTLMGGVFILLAASMIINRGTGSINDRVIYENEIKSDLTIERIYELLRDSDTPFGRAWIAEHRGYPGSSIVFGPGPYKDCVVISKKSGKLNIKHITRLENIIRDAEDEYRFGGIIDAKQTPIDPKNYSLFAADKLLSVMLVRHLREVLESMGKSGTDQVPREFDMAGFYYHNSTDGWYRDKEDREILRAENLYSPFTARVYNTDGEEMASISARKLDRRQRINSSAGFDVYAGEEHFGEMYPIKQRGVEGYTLSTDEGTFDIRIFPACRRANIACNYRIEKDGELKAVIGGSPHLVFNNTEVTQNDLILSYDDDYLVLYAVLELFIMTLNGNFLK